MHTFVTRRLALLLITLFAAPALSQSADQQWVVCANSSGSHSPDQAIAECSAIIQTGQISNDHLSMAYYNRGNSYRDKQDLDHAIADYDQAIRLNAQYAKAYNNRGLAYRDKQDLDRAIADYGQAIRLNAQYLGAYGNRGNAYAAKQDWNRAIADYGQAIRLDPQDAKTYYNRGNAHRAKRDWDRAIADYDQAIRLNAQYAKAYNNRGVVLIKLGKKAEGKADIAKAKSIDPAVDR